MGKKTFGFQKVANKLRKVQENLNRRGKKKDNISKEEDVEFYRETTALRSEEREEKSISDSDSGSLQDLKDVQARDEIKMRNIFIKQYASSAKNTCVHHDCYPVLVNQIAKTDKKRCDGIVKIRSVVNANILSPANSIEEVNKSDSESTLYSSTIVKGRGCREHYIGFAPSIQHEKMHDISRKNNKLYYLPQNETSKLSSADRILHNFDRQLKRPGKLSCDLKVDPMIVSSNPFVSTERFKLLYIRGQTRNTCGPHITDDVSVNATSDATDIEPRKPLLDSESEDSSYSPGSSAESNESNSSQSSAEVNNSSTQTTPEISADAADDDNISNHRTDTDSITSLYEAQSSELCPMEGSVRGITFFLIAGICFISLLCLIMMG